MAFSSDRERQEPSLEPDKRPSVGGGAPEAARPQQDTKPDNAPAENDPRAMFLSTARAQVREIDILIGDLQTMRDKLDSEATRIERAMAEYATFSETALQSSKVICESLQTGLQPFRDKRRQAKASNRARRKAARRLARISRRLGSAEPAERKREVQGS